MTALCHLDAMRDLMPGCCLYLINNAIKHERVLPVPIRETCCKIHRESYWEQLPAAPLNGFFL